MKKQESFILFEEKRIFLEGDISVAEQEEFFWSTEMQKWRNLIADTDLTYKKVILVGKRYLRWEAWATANSYKLKEEFIEHVDARYYQVWSFGVNAYLTDELRRLEIMPQERGNYGRIVYGGPHGETRGFDPVRNVVTVLEDVVLDIPGAIKTEPAPVNPLDSYDLRLLFGEEVANPVFIGFKHRKPYFTGRFSTPLRRIETDSFLMSDAPLVRMYKTGVIDEEVDEIYLTNLPRKLFSNGSRFFDHPYKRGKKEGLYYVIPSKNTDLGEYDAFFKYYTGARPDSLVGFAKSDFLHAGKSLLESPHTMKEWLASALTIMGVLVKTRIGYFNAAELELFIRNFEVYSMIPGFWLESEVGRYHYSRVTDYCGVDSLLNPQDWERQTVSVHQILMYHLASLYKKEVEFERYVLEGERLTLHVKNREEKKHAIGTGGKRIQELEGKLKEIGLNKILIR